MEGLEQLKEDQKTEEVLRGMFSQDTEQSPRKKFRISPQGILYHVEDDRWMMVVPKVLQKKIS